LTYEFFEADPKLVLDLRTPFRSLGR
jgi:hypothetical protein